MCLVSTVKHKKNYIQELFTIGPFIKKAMVGSRNNINKPKH